MKKHTTWMLIAGVVFGLAALGIIVYPLVSNLLASRHNSVVLTEYTESVEALEDDGLRALLEAAQAYNEALVPVTSEAFSRDALLTAAESYSELLNVSSSGVMGFVEIPAIGVYLPIYHGTDGSTLERGVGHLIGSSLPVGGASTHAVLTGHSGLAREKMFTDLDQLAEGDVFYLHVLDDTLAYEVDQIEVVLPEDTELLAIERGADYCTLVTCTPYATNTHRLLVRGHRVAYEEGTETPKTEQEIETAPSTWMREYVESIVGCLVAAATAGLTIWLVPRCGKRGKHEKR